MVPNVGIHHTSALMKDLLSHGHEFSFSQVMRLARNHLAKVERELPKIPWQERVWVRPNLNLTFPAADVLGVERGRYDSAELLITTTFLGLYGSSSPLPTHYSEDLLDEASADRSMSRDFLDLLHQRLYQLYFQCWSKYRLCLRVVEEKSHRDLERLFCLIGLGEKHLRDSVRDPESLLRYSGIFTQQPRSALGLQTLLRDALEIRELRVEQCILRRVPIPRDQQMRLGVSGGSLGEDTVVGSEVSDRMGKLRVHLGPLSREECATFLPGTTKYDKLVRLTKFYIQDPLDFDIEITMSAGEAQPIRLADLHGQRLGYNSWCFSGEKIGEVSSLLPTGQSEIQEDAPNEASHSCTVEETGPYTVIHYFQQELALLRDLAAGYAEGHPDIASLICGNPADPSVERLFEGVAFLNAHLQLRLDDEFPEIIYELTHAIQAGYLRPVPAATIVVFAPKRTCTVSQRIPVGTELKSVPVDGTQCRFTTRYPVEIHPLTITSASISQRYGKPAAIVLQLKLSGMTLSEWKLESLRFFLAGEDATADNIYLALLRHVKGITIVPADGGQVLCLDPKNLKPVGYGDNEALFPSQGTDNDPISMVHDFFLLPDKYKFIDLVGWEKWCGRGEGSYFEIIFDLEDLPFDIYQVCQSDFVLFATPAVNIFEHSAEPISTDTLNSEYEIKPVDGQGGHYEIHSIEHVTGILRNSNKKVSLKPLEEGKPQSEAVATYNVKWRQTGASHEPAAFLSVETTAQKPLGEISTLLVGLSCTNGALPGSLKVGDICRDTDNSPAFAVFSNCTTVSPTRNINLGRNALWKLFSLRGINLHRLTPEGFRATLRYIWKTYGSNSCCVQNRGIADLRIIRSDRLMGSSLVSGWEVLIEVDLSCYDSQGAAYRFAVLLDHFFTALTTDLNFIRTTVVDIHGAQIFVGAAKKGQRGSR